MIKLLESSLLNVILPLLAAVMLISIACNKKSTDSMTDIDSKRKTALGFASSYLGNKSEVIPNRDSTYFLCLKQNEPKTSFAVIDLNSNVLIKTQSVRGKVEWHDSHSIIVKERPGVIEDKRKKPSDYQRIINIKEGN